MSMPSMSGRLMALAFSLLCGCASLAQAATAVPVPPPAMGWASWNTFASTFDHQTIKAQVDALVASGLPSAGYVHVNIDEGWWQGQRDANGDMVVDTAQWPGGMKAIVDYIHSKGLKAGIYSDAGRDGCGYYFPTSGQPAAPRTGMEGHEAQDALQFQRWGFDFLKVDWCGGDVEGLDPRSTYQRISDAIAAATAVTGRPMTLSICNWGIRQPWNWGAGMAAMWRTSTDVIFFGETATTPKMLTNFDRSLHASGHHTGYVNDPDMLMVGMPGLTDAQNRLHLALWAMAGAPLLMGHDLTKMTPAVKAMLGNRTMVGIDQDARGLQGVKVAEDSAGLQVYAKMLSGTGQRAVLLLNRTGSAADIAMRWADMGLGTGTTTVRDVWSGASLASGNTGHTVRVAAGDAALVLVSGTEASGATYEAEATGNTRTGTAGAAACTGCSGGARVGLVGQGATLAINGVAAAAAGLKLVAIDYLNGDSTVRTATLQVNGQQPTVVSFPPTGSWSSVGTVSLLVAMRQGANNTLTLGNPSAWTPDIDAIQVQALPGTNGTALVGGASGRCADIPDNGIVDGTQATLWDCHGGQNQTFTATSRGELVVYGNKCLDADNSGTANGTRLILWTCNGQDNQKWNLNANGTITNRQSGLCVDAASNGTVNGTRLQLWACHGGLNQKWTRQ